MTDNDRKRIEEMRYRTRTLGGDVDFLLAEIDKRDEALREILKAWDGLGKYKDDDFGDMDEPISKARKALGEE
jgi:hypothetical protein